MQSDHSLCLSLEYSMTVKKLTKYHLEFLNLKGGCTGSSESTLVKMTHFYVSRFINKICIPFITDQQSLLLNREFYMSA